MGFFKIFVVPPNPDNPIPPIPKPRDPQARESSRPVGKRFTGLWAVNLGAIASPNTPVFGAWGLGFRVQAMAGFVFSCCHGKP